LTKRPALFLNIIIYPTSILGNLAQGALPEDVSAASNSVNTSSLNEKFQNRRNYYIYTSGLDSFN
jgi:hypothetical protein